MELRYLNLFCRVYEKKSFSRAADSLYLTQPTVSAHIKSLEEEVGIKLFDRLGREVLPTKGGELLYGYAKRIEKLDKEARDALAHFTGSFKGHLDIGGSTIPGEYLLPDVIGGFRKDYPEVISTLHIGDTKEVAEMVMEGEVEVGMVGAMIKDNRIENRKYCDDELILIASPSYPDGPLGSDRIAKVPLIARELGSGSRAAMEKVFGDKGISVSDLNIVAEMGSTEAVKTAVKSGLGLSIVSTLAVKDELAHGSLKMVKVSSLPITRTLYVITHKTKARSPLCRAFLDFIYSKR